MSTPSLDPAVEDMFTREDAETAAYEVDVLGDSYLVLPGVFSPKIRRNSSWYADRIPPLLYGSSFLEIGSGAGVLAVRAARLGYAVVATDIDPAAVENTGQNAARHGVRVDARLGSVYDPLHPDERFDSIFWNHPWMLSEGPVNARHAVSYDQGYTGVGRFIREGKEHLASGGQLLVGTGSLARTDLIEDWAREAGFGIEVCAREVQPLVVGGEKMVEFMVYRLSA